jgi:hypothetical protein
VVLVTGAAFDCIDTLPLGSTANLHGVAMAILSLTRIVSDGVAVHAAGVAQYWHKRFKGSRRSSIVVLHHVLRRCVDWFCFGMFTPLSGRPYDQYKQQTTCRGHSDRERLRLANPHVEVPSFP